MVERSEIMLGDHRKFWFQTANFGWSNVSNTKNNLKLTFLGKKTHFIERKTQNSQFSENDPFFEGSQGPKGVM